MKLSVSFVQIIGQLVSELHSSTKILASLLLLLRFLLSLYAASLFPPIYPPPPPPPPLQVVVAADPGTGNLGSLVRQLSIDHFENEGRRISAGPDSAGAPRRLLDRQMSIQGVHKKVSSPGLMC